MSRQGSRMFWEGSGVFREGFGVSRERSRVSRAGSGMFWEGSEVYWERSGVSRGALAAHVPPSPHGTEGLHPRPPIAAGVMSCPDSASDGLGAAAPTGFFLLSRQPWRGGACDTVPRVLPMNREGSRGVWHGRGLLTRWAPQGAPCLASGRERVQEFSPVLPVPRMPPPPACLNSSLPQERLGRGDPAPRFGSVCPPRCDTEKAGGAGRCSDVMGSGDRVHCVRHMPPSP